MLCLHQTVLGSWGTLGNLWITASFNRPRKFELISFKYNTFITITVFVEGTCYNIRLFVIILVLIFLLIFLLKFFEHILINTNTNTLWYFNDHEKAAAEEKTNQKSCLKIQQGQLAHINWQIKFFSSKADNYIPRLLVIVKNNMNLLNCLINCSHAHIKHSTHIGTLPVVR